MMKLSRLKKFKVCFALLVSLFTIAGVGNLVLCFGEDGHVALEFSPTGRCATAAEAVGDHCGPCVDIPLLAGTSDHQLTLVEAPSFREVIASIPQIHFVGAGPEADRWQPLWLSSNLLPDTILASLRTVVLVI